MKTIIVDALPGDHISTVIKEMVDSVQAGTRYQKAVSDFNGVRIIATEQDTVESVQKQFERKTKASRKAYRRSTVHKRQKRERKEELKQLNREGKELLQTFKTVDKTNYEALLSWLTAFQPYSDRVGLKLPKYKVLQTLKQYGYQSDENTEENYNSEDKENAARYLIGQCVSGLERPRAIHPVLVKFHKEWKEKFVA